MERRVGGFRPRPVDANKAVLETLFAGREFYLVGKGRVVYHRS